jgi:hypothetical protein
MSDDRQRSASIDGTTMCDLPGFRVLFAAFRQPHSHLSAIVTEDTSRIGRNNPDEAEIKALVSLARKHNYPRKS